MVDLLFGFGAWVLVVRWGSRDLGYSEGVRALRPLRGCLICVSLICGFDLGAMDLGTS